MKWGKGDMDGKFRARKLSYKKNGDGENNQVVGNFIHPSICRLKKYAL